MSQEVSEQEWHRAALYGLSTYVQALWTVTRMRETALARRVSVLERATSADQGS